jgi:hypothetical protein
MKVIKIQSDIQINNYFKFIGIDEYGYIFHIKNGQIHREDGPAYHDDKMIIKEFYYKDLHYIYSKNFIQFTNSSWKKKVKELKRQDRLSIFL